MQKRIGRPMKYKHFLRILEDETLYSASTIVYLGKQKGFLDEIPESDLKKTITKIRHAMSRLAHNHNFPREGDKNGELIFLSGQGPMRGWRGSRWKEAANIIDENKNESETTEQVKIISETRET